MMSQPLCYFLIKNDDISGSSSISNDNFGAINNWKNSGSMPEFFVLEKLAQVQCCRSIHRLNLQAQYSDSISMFFVQEKLLKLNVAALCLGLMCLIYLVYFR